MLPAIYHEQVVKNLNYIWICFSAQEIYSNNIFCFHSFKRFSLYWCLFFYSRQLIKYIFSQNRRHSTWVTQRKYRGGLSDKQQIISFEFACFYCEKYHLLTMWIGIPITSILVVMWVITDWQLKKCIKGLLLINVSFFIHSRHSPLCRKWYNGDFTQKGQLMNNYLGLHYLPIWSRYSYMPVTNKANPLLRQKQPISRNPLYISSFYIISHASTSII